MQYQSRQTIVKKCYLDVYRGAELINTHLFKKVAKMKQAEEDVLTGIKRKMEKIKMRQQRLQQEKAILETDDHYIGE